MASATGGFTPTRIPLLLRSTHSSSAIPGNRFESPAHRARGEAHGPAKDLLMSKKQKTTSKKALPKKAKRAGSARRARPTLASATSTTAGTTDDADDGSASRLPAVGTVIIKRDRHGVARCQCTVVEGGIRYKSR